MCNLPGHLRARIQSKFGAKIYLTIFHSHSNSMYFIISRTFRIFCIFYTFYTFYTFYSVENRKQRAKREN